MSDLSDSHPFGGDQTQMTRVHTRSRTCAHNAGAGSVGCIHDLFDAALPAVCVCRLAGLQAAAEDLPDIASFIKAAKISGMLDNVFARE